MDLGLEWAGFETKWFCEIEPFPRKVLEKHWPGVPIIEDVRDVTKGNVQPVDVIVGGFPCQDISWAGKGRGIDYDLSGKEGTRSGLWWEMWRVIRDLRPRYVIAENVPALTHRGLDIVLGSLAQIGYDAEWQTISAASVGAPHIRERVFIVAYPTGERAGRGPGVIQEANGGSGERIRESVKPSAAYVAYRNNTGLEGQPRDGSKVNEPRRVGARQDRQVGGSSLQPNWFGGPTGQPWPVSFKVPISDGFGLEEQGLRHANVKSAEHGSRNREVGNAGGEGLERSSRESGRRSETGGSQDERGVDWNRDVPDPEGSGQLRASKYENDGADLRQGRGYDASHKDAGGSKAGGKWLETEYDFCGVAYGVSDRVGALKGYGNAVVPQVGYLVGRAVMAHYMEGKND